MKSTWEQSLNLNREHSDVVLIVDDVPDNVSLLLDALDESGCTVLVALDGQAALQRAEQARPDIVLLDAMMPGLDGFEVARRLKAQDSTAQIPIIFMTGLSEAEHVVAALQAGGSDYVSKPIRPQEVLARMQVHLQAARERRQTRNALDALGHASFTVRASDGRLLWQTARARELLQRYYGGAAQTATQASVPEPVLAWLQRSLEHLRLAHLRGDLRAEAPRLSVVLGARRLILRLHMPLQPEATAGRQDVGPGQVSPADADAALAGVDRLVVMQEICDAAVFESMAHNLQLTAKEAEVLYWVIKGKINRDIGLILGSSPMTVKKHLERIYAKLGVETRTAAAGLALHRLRCLQPELEI